MWTVGAGWGPNPGRSTALHRDPRHNSIQTIPKTRVSGQALFRLKRGVTSALPVESMVPLRPESAIAPVKLPVTVARDLYLPPENTRHHGDAVDIPHLLGANTGQGGTDRGSVAVGRTDHTALRLASWSKRIVEHHGPLALRMPRGRRIDLSFDGDADHALHRGIGMGHRRVAIGSRRRLDARRHAQRSAITHVAGVVRLLGQAAQIGVRPP